MKRRVVGFPGVGRLVLFVCDLCPKRAVCYARPGAEAVPAGWRSSPLPAPNPPADASEGGRVRGVRPRRALHECPRCSRGWRRAERVLRAERAAAGFARGSSGQAPSRRARSEGEDRP